MYMSGGYGYDAEYIIFTLYIGLSLNIADNDLVVKEGEDIDIVCSPSSPTVAVDWDLPSSVSSDPTTVVDYLLPLRQTLTLRRANIRHSGVYSCRVVGDVNRTISIVSATVSDRESEILQSLSMSYIYSVIVLRLPTKPCLWKFGGF